MKYFGKCEGGPHHNKMLERERPRVAIPVLENNIPVSANFSKPMPEQLVEAKVGHYVFVPEHWKWIPPE